MPLHGFDFLIVIAIFVGAVAIVIRLVHFLTVAFAREVAREIRKDTDRP